MSKAEGLSPTLPLIPHSYSLVFEHRNEDGRVLKKEQKQANEKKNQKDEEERRQPDRSTCNVSCESGTSVSVSLNCCKSWLRHSQTYVDGYFDRHTEGQQGKTITIIMCANAQEKKKHLNTSNDFSLKLEETD